MAMLKGKGGGRKAPSLRPDMYFYIRNGKRIAAKWPRKRGPSTNPSTIWQNRAFALANNMAKSADGLATWMVYKLAEGQSFYPRDLLMSAAYGRLLETIEVDGRLYKSMALIDDISDDLDKLAAAAPGTMLIRTSQRWYALSPGDENDILRIGPATGMPTWEDRALASNPVFTGNQPDGATHAGAYATKGNAWMPQRDTWFFSLGVYGNFTAGHTVRGGIYRVNSSNVITDVLGETVPFTITVTGPQAQFLGFPQPVLAPQFERLMFVYSRTDGAGTYVLPVYGADPRGMMPNFPIQPYTFGAAPGGYALLNKANPQIGDGFTYVAGPGISMQARLQVI